MKKLLSLAFTAILLLSLAGCSSSKSYTPVYGDKLQVNTNLEYKQEYQKAISSETRKAMEEYLIAMADFYNSVDPAQEQNLYFTHSIYIVSNNFFKQIKTLEQPLIAKLDNGETLTADEQLFGDAFKQIKEIPEKITEIDNAALNVATEKVLQNTVQNDKTASSSSSTASSSEVALSSDSSSKAPEITLSIDSAQWEELFNIYVKAFDLIFNEPFVK